MEKVLRDEQFQKLLKEKQRLELLSMIIPFIGIISLLVFLYLFTKSMMISSIIVLSIVVFLIIGQYIFDSKLSGKIDDMYLELNRYFQEEIVPKLLKRDNESIVFDNNKDIDISIIDSIDLFNVYKRYNSRFHYDGLIAERPCSFDELIFTDDVNYNTRGLKELDKKVEHNVNYHAYGVEINTHYNAEALFVINGFEELDSESIVSFSKIDLGARTLGVKDELDFSFYLKETKNRGLFMKDKILNLFHESEFKYHSLVIYVKENKLYIIIEEFENLINTPHSKKFTIEKLMIEYKGEQYLVEKIIQAFEL